MSFVPVDLNMTTNKIHSKNAWINNGFKSSLQANVPSNKLDEASIERLKTVIL